MLHGWKSLSLCETDGVTDPPAGSTFTALKETRRALKAHDDACQTKLHVSDFIEKLLSHVTLQISGTIRK